MSTALSPFKILPAALLCLLAANCSDGYVQGPEPEVGVVDDSLLTGPVPYRGVNLAGADFGATDTFGHGALPGTFGTNYMYPDPNYASGYNGQSYYVGKGMTAFRLPFRWERVQRNLNSALDSTELGRLRTTVNDITGKGAVVILDPHNY